MDEFEATRIHDSTVESLSIDLIDEIQLSDPIDPFAQKSNVDFTGTLTQDPVPDFANHETNQTDFNNTATSTLQPSFGDFEGDLIGSPVQNQVEVMGTTQASHAVQNDLYASTPNQESLPSPLSFPISSVQRVSILSPSDKPLPSPLPPAPQGRLNPIPPALDPLYFALPTRKWTDPSTFADVPVHDQMNDLIRKVFPGTIASPERPARKLTSIDEALLSPDPYLVLVKAKSWRALAILARHDVVATHPKEVPTIMRLWTMRMYALSRLGHVTLMDSEIEKLGDFDSADMMFEKYPDVWPGQRGYIVPLEVRLLVNQVPFLKTGNHFESVHKMYKLLYTYSKWNQSGLLTTDVFKNFRVRILSALAKLFVAAGDLVSASSLLTAGLSLSESNNVDLLSSLGRTFLQMGDAVSARTCFIRVEVSLGVSPPLNISNELNEDNPALVPDISRPDLILSNRAFLFITEGKYESAVKYLTELATRAPTFVSGINNLSISQLYMGNVQQASSFLESVAIDLPNTAGACQELLFNLCTLYDLTDHSTEKKKRLIAQVVSKSAGDDFKSECMKL